MKNILPISIVTTTLVLAFMAVGQSSRTLAGEKPAAARSSAAAGTGRFEGKYCAGAGDVGYLKLIDESFAFFHANPDRAEPDDGLSARLGHLRGGRRLGRLVDPEQLRILLRRDSFSPGALVLHAATLVGPLLGQPGRRQADGPVGRQSHGQSALAVGGPRRLPGRRRHSRLHRLQARRRRCEDPRLVLRGHRGGRGDAGRNPAGQPRSKGDGALSAENGAGLQLHRKRPAIRRTISFSSGRRAICSPPATAASSSPTARSARDIWRASRSPIWRRWTEWWNCTSSPATRRSSPSTSAGRRSPASRCRNC